MTIDLNDAPKQPPEEKEVVTPEGISKLPTIYSDAFFLTYWPDRVKISFGETIEEAMEWRTAVLMPIYDARALAQRLAAAIAEIDKEIAAQEKDGD